MLRMAEDDWRPMFYLATVTLPMKAGTNPSTKGDAILLAFRVRALVQRQLYRL